MSRSPTVELRSLLAEVLGEAARAFEEPSGPRGPELLRLAAADAALLGYAALSHSLRSLSGLLDTQGGAVPSPAALARGLGSIARTVALGGELERELESLDGMQTNGHLEEPAELSAEQGPGAAGPLPEPPAAPPAARIYFEPAPPSLPAPAELASPAPGMAAGRAVLVDPAPVNRSALARLLRRLRWEVREFEAAPPALEAVARGEADLFIADARRLRVDPAALVAAVRRCAGERSVPVAFVAEETRGFEVYDLLRSGAAAVVRRPTDENALSRALESVRPAGGTA